MSSREGSMSEGPIKTALFYCDDENCLVVTAFIVGRTPRYYSRTPTCYNCGSKRGTIQLEGTEPYVRGLKIGMVFMDESKLSGSGASSFCSQDT